MRVWTLCVLIGDKLPFGWVGKVVGKVVVWLLIPVLYVPSFVLGRLCCHTVDGLVLFALCVVVELCCFCDDCGGWFEHVDFESGVVVYECE